MISRVRLFAIVLGCLAGSLATTRADDDPLPKGAKARFGSARMVFRAGTEIALLPPDYTTAVTADAMGGLRRFDVATGRPLDKATGDAFPRVGIAVSANGKRGVAVGPGILSVRDVA